MTVKIAVIEINARSVDSLEEPNLRDAHDVGTIKAIANAMKTGYWPN